MVSQMSQGLFQNVIAMSGALAWQKKLRTNNIHDAKQLAKRMNCSDESIGDMIKCLKNVRV
jgi:predicted alpha/beta superfamily hydrolase